MKKYLFLIIIILTITLIAGFARAEYELEVSIPGAEGAQEGDTVSLPQYIRYIYLFVLSAVGITAVGALVFGGFQYMLSAGSITSAEEAKKWIWGAIFGLVLALSAYLILYTINPKLLEFGIILPEMPEHGTSGGTSGGIYRWEEITDCEFLSGVTCYGDSFCPYSLKPSINHCCCGEF